MGFILSVTDPLNALGCTYTALGTAKAFADRTSDAVLLIDCSRGFDIISREQDGQTAVAYDLGDVLCDRCDPSDAVYRCSDGYYIMPASADASVVQADKVGLLASEISGSFAAVIICCPSADFYFAGDIADYVSLSAICFGADRLSVDAAARLRRNLPAESESCGIIVTDYSSEGVRKGDLLCLDDCIDTVEARLLAVIPSKNPAQAYANFAARISGVKTPLIKL